MVRKVAVTEGDTRCWEDLVRAVKRESEMSGGYGEVVVSIKFHKGAPRGKQQAPKRPRKHDGPDAETGLVNAMPAGAARVSRMAWQVSA
jgi:hypothetical protein